MRHQPHHGLAAAATLEHHGLVERDAATHRYGIGYTALEVATAAGYDGLARRARPILQRVAKDAGESVMLAVARTFSLVYVDQVDPPAIPTPNWLGRQLPLHATSAGKVFLAWLPEDERDAVLPSVLERYTAHTVTDRARLFASLADVRRDGYARAWASSRSSRTASRPPSSTTARGPAVI